MIFLSSITRALVNFDRSAGCIPTCSLLSEVPEIHSGSSPLTVSVPAIWSMHLFPPVHKGVNLRPSSPEREGAESIRLFRLYLKNRNFGAENENAGCT